MHLLAASLGHFWYCWAGNRKVVRNYGKDCFSEYVFFWPYFSRWHQLLVFIICSSGWGFLCISRFLLSPPKVRYPALSLPILGQKAENLEGGVIYIVTTLMVLFPGICALHHVYVWLRELPCPRQKGSPIMPLYRGLHLHFICTITSLLHNPSYHQRAELTISYLTVYPHSGYPAQISSSYILLSSWFKTCRSGAYILTFSLLHQTGIKPFSYHSQDVAQRTKAS